MFQDDLLASYEQMETAFAKRLYELYKGFEFRTLWDVSGTMTTYDRQASAAAAGTGKLGGVLELSKAIQAIDNIEFKAKKCFTTMGPTTHSHKWTFDNVKDQTVRTYTIWGTPFANMGRWWRDATIRTQRFLLTLTNLYFGTQFYETLWWDAEFLSVFHEPNHQLVAVFSFSRNLNHSFIKWDQLSVS